MSQESKNPLIAGFVNMLVPGSGYLYVDNDRPLFIKTFVGGVLVVAAMVTLGNAIQNIRGFSLPSGLCTGLLLLMVYAPLFLMGQKTANAHNNASSKTTQYNAQRQASQGTNDDQLSKIRKMRDEGLISDQEYQKKKDKLSSK